MSLGQAIGAGAILTAAFLVWRNRAEAAQEAVYMPAVEYRPAPQNQYQPILEWGLSTLMNLGKSRNTGGTTQPGYTLASATPTSAGAYTSGGFDVNSLLNFIGKHEAPGGYNQVYGGSVIEPPRPITTMTISEVMDWQRRSVAAGSASSAAGRYQIIRPTLGELVRQGHARSSDYFSPATQDRLAQALLERRGLAQYQGGQISAEQFGNNLSKEWASLPVVTGPKAGKSYYDGDGLNSALTSVDAFLKTLTGGWV